MENKKILIDTSIIIDHLRKKEKQKSLLSKIPEDYELFISSVSIFELFCGATDQKKEQDIENIIQLFTIMPISMEIAKISGKTFLSLKRKNKIIDIRDLFIGITALKNKLQLFTTNVKHFERINELKLFTNKH